MAEQVGSDAIPGIVRPAPSPLRSLRRAALGFLVSLAALLALLLALGAASDRKPGSRTPELRRTVSG